MKASSFLIEPRHRLFVSISRLSSRLPAFRGRTRVFLLLYQVLGLSHHSLLVDARLRRPVPFSARLNIQSWLQRIAFLTGGYESETVDFLHRLWQSRAGSGYLLDIGANVGMISIPFALMARATASDNPLVIAVEAVPDNARALETNIGLNDLGTEVVVIESALGDAEKTIHIQVEGDLASGEGSGTANILPDDSTYACVTQPLVLRTLDGLLASGLLAANCSVIKIDTDGYDLKVLEGAVGFLGKCRPVIFGEFSAHCMQWHKQSIADVERFAENMDYDVFFRNEENSLTFAREQPIDGFVQDLLLVPRENCDEFSWCIETA